MVQVRGTKGNVVQVEILGIGEVIRMLQAKGQQIKTGADMGVVRAGTYVQEEVKESVIGNRAEHKSVDTGIFANSIEFVKLGEASGIIKPQRKSYPSGQTTEDVAKILEHSSKIVGGPRRHFGNTRIRTEKKIRDIINAEVTGKVISIR